MRPKIIVGATVALLCFGSVLAWGEWVDAWSRTPLSTTVTKFTPALQPTTPASFSNQTFRLIVWTTLGGTQVRVRLTNAFSATTLSIGAAHMALRQSGGTIVSGTDQALTFAGSTSTVVPANGEIWSDPVSLTVTAHTDLAVSLYLPQTFTPTTFHPTGLKTSYVSSAGNFVASTTMPSGSQTTMIFFVDRVQVLAAGDPAIIVTLGDSITDGASASININGAWPDLLSSRLPSLSDGTPVGLINAGIGSNRFETIDGAGTRGLYRLTELLTRPAVRWVILLEGINDISYESATSAELIAAYQNAISQAHAANVKIIGVPLLPIKNSVKDTPQNLATRAAVNTWISTSGAFDAIIDFNPVVQDPADHDSMLASLTSDYVHPNQAGNQAMANSIDLNLFQLLINQLPPTPPRSLRHQ